MTAIPPGTPLPNFCAWLARRFGPDWTLRPGSVPRAAFLAAKREYEAALGCRVYGHEYGRRFYGIGGDLVEHLPPAPDRDRGPPPALPAPEPAGG